MFVHPYSPLPTVQIGIDTVKANLLGHVEDYQFTPLLVPSATVPSKLTTPSAKLEEAKDLQEMISLLSGPIQSIQKASSNLRLTFDY